MHYRKKKNKKKESATIIDTSSGRQVVWTALHTPQ